MKIIFLLLLIAFSLIAIAEVTFVLYIYESKTVLQNQILNDAEQKNLMMINRMDSYMSERTIDMLNLVHDRSVIQAVISSNNEFQNMSDPRQYIEEQNVTWMTVPRSTITPLMNSIIENPTADRLRVMIDMEKSLFHNNDVFGRLLIANSYGADVAGSIKPDDYDQLTDPWYVSAKQNGVYIDGITFDKASGHVSIAISTRMDDVNGNFLGVAKGTIIVDNIINIMLDQLESGQIKPSEITLINKQGEVLYSTNDSEKPFEYFYPIDFMQNIKNQAGHFSAVEESDNTTKYVTYATSSSSKITPTAGWVLLVSYDPEDLIAPVKQMSDLLIIIMLVIISITFSGIFLFTSKIEKPFALVAQALTGFTKGNIIHIEPSGTDETKEIASDFNSMTEIIQKTNQQLISSEEKYHLLFDLSPDPIRIVNKDGITIDVNTAFVRKFGYSKNEIIGTPIFMIMDENNKNIAKKILEDLNQGVIVENKELFFRKKDGTFIPVLLSAAPLRNSENIPIGYIAVIKDETEIYESRKKIERDDKKLEEQYIELRQIDKQKDEFASMISHELTTPLFPIKFHADMLRDQKAFGKLNNEQLNSVTEIYENSKKLERLISDILDAQKLEMGVIKFTETHVQLDKFMDDIEHNNRPLVVEKQIRIINSTKDKIEVVSDVDRLNQVFSNLIKNSADFVSEKTGIIEINAKVQENDILFYVKDNGSGIPKEKQANLFKKFYQIDTSTTRKHRGSGLGLSICKGIIEGLGGKIWLESTVNVGTIVYFTIPIKK